MLESVPTITETAMKTSSVGANPMPSALSEESTRLKMITPLRPIRSVNAPPIALPTRPDTEKTANSRPTVDMPMSNFFVRYKAKNGIQLDPAEAIYEHNDVVNPERLWVFVVDRLKFCQHQSHSF